MVREILTIGIGQAGIQLSQAIWRQYCVEHNIECDGSFKPYWYKRGPTKYRISRPDTSFLEFFEESDSNQFVPRSILGIIIRFPFPSLNKIHLSPK